MTSELLFRAEMVKERLLVLASAVVALSHGACTPAPQPRIEVLGPLIDSGSEPSMRRVNVQHQAVSPPVPEEKPDEPNTPGSTEDITNRLDKLKTSIQRLDNQLRPTWMEKVPGQSDEGDGK